MSCLSHGANMSSECGAVPFYIERQALGCEQTLPGYTHRPMAATHAPSSIVAILFLCSVGDFSVSSRASIAQLHSAEASLLILKPCRTACRRTRYAQMGFVKGAQHIGA